MRRLEHIFYSFLSLFPFAMGVCYAIVNMTGGWAHLIDGHDHAFYKILQSGFSFSTGLATVAGVFAISWFVANRFRRNYASRKGILFDMLWLFALSFGLRAFFCLIFGQGIGCMGEPMWSWQRACGMPISDPRQVLFPAWINFALLMKAFVSVFGGHFDLFQLMETAWGGIGSAAIFLLVLEMVNTRRLAMFAGMLHALSPNGIVYMTALATPEHAAAPLFCLAAWMFMRCVLREMSVRRMLAWSACSGFCLGLGDAVKPFFPVFLSGVIVFSGGIILRGLAGHWRKTVYGLLAAVGALVLVRCLVCSAVTAVSARVFGCELDRADSMPHFICVGLDRRGEGMIHLSHHARQYMRDRLKGVSRKEAADAAYGVLKDDWEGHWSEIPAFLAKKTIWAWQEDGSAFFYYGRNVRCSGTSCAPAVKYWPVICRHGESAALVYYFALMFFACACAARMAISASATKRIGLIFPGLLIMFFFCLMLVSESQGRYKCLVMPYVTAYAACLLLPRGMGKRRREVPTVSNDRLCVVMPVYNEQDAVGEVLSKWVKELDRIGMDYVIRPYNDGSRDDSLAVMRAKATELNCGRMKIDVRDKPNGGHGHTVLTGYREAVADGFGWIFQIDSDDEMGPERFAAFWSCRSDYDFLVGIRDGRRQQLSRKIMSLVSRLCVRIFYGRSVWDVNSPYRLMRAATFGEFYWRIPLATFAPNIILSGLAARYGLRCFEARVPHHERITGCVSIRKWKLLKVALRSFAQTVFFSLRNFRDEAADDGI